MTMRRLALMAAAALVPLIPTAPAYAADHVICVNGPVGVTCDETALTIPAAITAANANSVDDTIAVGPGTYNDGPYVLNGTTHHLTLRGSGQGVTLLTISPSVSADNYLSVHGATVRDLTVSMTGTTSDGDVGVDASSSATLTGITVDGADATGATGIALANSSLSTSTVQMARSPNANTTGVNSLAASAVTDTVITASGGYANDSPGAGSTVSRVSIKGNFYGIQQFAGSLTVDDTLIDLGTSTEGVGLLAANDNNSNTPKSVAADHVTIVGGATNTFGVAAYARAAAASQLTTIDLTNSIVSGPETDLYVEASNDGFQGADSTASITTSYSRWTTTQVLPGAHGAATITSGAGHLTASPGFRNPTGGDYRLAASSPLIDKGAPGSSGPAMDLGKGARVLDGNGDGTAVRDMGAYEAPKKVVVPDTTAPNTTLTSHPRKRTTKRRATFRFTANESHVTFQCRIDKKPWGACTSPTTVRVARGWHTFRVRARDHAGNLDATPATWRFKRV